MATESKSDYQRKFIARVKEARELSGHTQESIAVLLGLAQDHYKQFESRSALPHYLVPQFCSITRVNMAWLMGEQGPRAVKAAAPRPGKSPERRPRP